MTVDEIADEILKDLDRASAGLSTLEWIELCEAVAEAAKERAERQRAELCGCRPGPGRSTLTCQSHSLIP
jgi:hypothetical protein